MQENRSERRRQKRLGLAVGTRNVFRSSGIWENTGAVAETGKWSTEPKLDGDWVELALKEDWDSLYEESRARRGTVGRRQRQVNNLQPWRSLSGQEQMVCFHSQKYSTAGATGDSLLQTVHVPLLLSITGQAQTSSPPEQGYTADHDSLLMLSGML